MTQFVVALHWVIKLTNYATDNLRGSFPDKVCKVELVEYPSQTKYSLWGNSDYFFAGMDEYCVPELLGDAIFTVRQVAFDHIAHHLSKGDIEYCTQFVNGLKQIILKEANNTMLCTALFKSFCSFLCCSCKSRYITNPFAFNWNLVCLSHIHFLNLQILQGVLFIIGNN